jgi:hypothetical protein
MRKLYTPVGSFVLSAVADRVSMRRGADGIVLQAGDGPNPKVADTGVEDLVFVHRQQQRFAPLAREAYVHRCVRLLSTWGVYSSSRRRIAKSVPWTSASVLAVSEQTLRSRLRECGLLVSRPCLNQRSAFDVYLTAR